MLDLRELLLLITANITFFRRFLLLSLVAFNINETESEAKSEPHTHTDTRLSIQNYDKCSIERQRIEWQHQ